MVLPSPVNNEVYLHGLLSVARVLPCGQRIAGTKEERAGQVLLARTDPECFPGECFSKISVALVKQVDVLHLYLGVDGSCRSGNLLSLAQTKCGERTVAERFVLQEGIVNLKFK